MCLATSSLLMAFRIGQSVITMMVWAWKYGQSFLEAIIKEKAIVSILVYFASTP